MSVLPLAIHSVAQVRAMDCYAIDVLGIPGYVLMTRAATAALTALRTQWPEAKQVLVICGAGNNAGDGYVLARLALAAQLQVKVIALSDPQQLTGDAHQAWRDFTAAGAATLPWTPAFLAEADVIVDAIFGTGLSRPLDAPFIDYIQAINASARPVLSLDVPSGLNADTGAMMGAAIHAHSTLSFIGLKQGFYLGAGPDYTGKLLFDDLQVPASVAQQVGCVAQRIDAQVVRQALPRRSRLSHKGDHGHVLLVGGGIGMAGAIRLSAEACLRVGAGWVTVATRPEHVSALVAARPEIMCRGVNSAQELQPLLQAAQVIAIGPGLGQDGWARDLFDAVMSSNKQLIVDADALNLLAQRTTATAYEHEWVLTPHPGEAARLLGTDTKQIQSARLQEAHELVARYGGTVVLKGAGTWVLSNHEVPSLCDRGNPGMAAPGMGDVLTGVIAGIAAQCGNISLAARAGVYVHAVAGDMAASAGERGMLASDLFAHLRSCVNP